MSDGSLLAAVERVYRRVLLSLGRGRITLADDSGSVQTVQAQISASEVYDNTPRVAEYGFTSLPPSGSDAVLVFIGGDRSNGVVVGTNHQASRLKNLQTGEVAIFDDQGQSVWIKRGGIVIEGAGKPITINGNVQINGAVTATGEGTFDGHSVGHHTHGGVQSGGSNTNTPTS